MKKNTKIKKLVLDRETVLILTQTAQGGTSPTLVTYFCLSAGIQSCPSLGAGCVSDGCEV